MASFTLDGRRGAHVVEECVRSPCRELLYLLSNISNIYKRRYGNPENFKKGHRSSTSCSFFACVIITQRSGTEEKCSNKEWTAILTLVLVTNSRTK